MLVVFDLDLTLWNCGGTWCDATSPPYTLKQEIILDSLGTEILLMPEARLILDDLKKKGMTMALASRTGAPDWALELLDMFRIKDYFTFMEIYPGSKTSHFKRLKQNSGIPFHKMLFFDDEYRNIEEVSNLGVECIYVPDGINQNLVQSGLQLLLNNKS